ncbi:gluconate utilization system Gnt-I transcriptional repressor [Klebsiella variicola]|nr:gluconate utilization system Gnt-I transcriptional repressor [Klebsiella variicola]
MLDAGMTPYSVMVEQSSSYSSGIELMRQARREYRSLTVSSVPTMTLRSARRLNASAWG